MSDEVLDIKIEVALKKALCRVRAIRVYLPELMKEINQCTERGEEPTIFLKSIIRKKTKLPQIELVFMGNQKDRHIEDLGYYLKHPRDWNSWGEIVLTPEQALDLAHKIIFVLKGLEKVN